MGSISLANGGTTLISRGWIGISASSRSPAVSLSFVYSATGFRMNLLHRPYALNFAVILNLLLSIGFSEWVLLVLTAIVMQTSV